jgi:hypothetical protein
MIPVLPLWFPLLMAVPLLHNQSVRRRYLIQRIAGNSPSGNDPESAVSRIIRREYRIEGR